MALDALSIGTSALTSPPHLRGDDITQQARIAVTAKTAASMFDMPVSEFLRLVDAGIMPKPKPIGAHERWSFVELNAVVSGEAMVEEFEP